MAPSDNLLTSQDVLDLPDADEEDGAAAPPIKENEIKVDVSAVQRMQTDIQERLRRKIQKQFQDHQKAAIEAVIRSSLGNFSNGALNRNAAIMIGLK